jgi:hypothetical protein
MEVSGGPYGTGAPLPGIRTGGSGVLEKKILLPLPGFETRIDQNVVYTLHRMILVPRLPSSGRAAIRGMQISVCFKMTNFGKTSKASALSSNAKKSKSIIWNENKTIRKKMYASP